MHKGTQIRVNTLDMLQALSDQICCHIIASGFHVRNYRPSYNIQLQRLRTVHGIFSHKGLIHIFLLALSFGFRLCMS